MPADASIFRADAFANRCGIVTGGGTGLGFAVASELLSVGASVLICGRSEEKLAAAKASVPAEQRLRLHTHTVSLRDEASIAACVEHAISTLGRIDFLVNNAGGQFVAPAAAISAKGFRAVVETNLVGTFVFCREVYTQWMGEHGGAIVNITMVVNNGISKMSHSSAARAGVDNLCRTLASEWAPAGVRVNAVAPGVVYTKSGFANYGDLGPVMMKAFADVLPFKRLGTAEEVSAAVLFLLSPAAAYTSGTTLQVDGGLALVGYPEPLRDHGDACALPVWGDETVLPPAAKL